MLRTVAATQSLPYLGDGVIKRPNVVIVQVLGEVPVDAALMYAPGTPKNSPAFVGDHSIEAAAIACTRFPAHQSGVLHPLNQPTKPTPAQQDGLRQGLHPEAALRGLIELEQHVVPG